MVQNVSAISCWKLGLWNTGSMYVACPHGKNLWNIIIFFEGQIGKILEGDCEVY